MARLPARRDALEQGNDAFEVAADVELALGGGAPGFEVDLFEARVLFLHALDEAPLAGLEAEFTAGGEGGGAAGRPAGLALELGETAAGVVQCGVTLLVGCAGLRAVVEQGLDDSGFDAVAVADRGDEVG